MISCHLNVQQFAVRSILDISFRRVRNMAESDCEIRHVRQSVRCQ